MIPFTTFYGMRMNPFDKELPSRDAYKPWTWNKPRAG